MPNNPSNRIYVLSVLSLSLLLGSTLGSACHSPFGHDTSSLSTSIEPPQGSKNQKLSPFLSTLSSLSRTLTDPQTRSDLRMLRSIGFFRTNNGSLEVRTLFNYTGSLDTLHALQIYPDAHSGTIYTAWVPLRSIQEWAQLPALKQASLSYRLHPHLNVSAPLVYAPQVRRTYSLDGRGVLVGIVDTGIDIYHPAFRKENGDTRIVAILDFSIEDPSTKRPPRLFTAAEINRALRSSSKTFAHVDKAGHGTHVAGIAAGNGRQTQRNQGRRYTGIAPRAELIVVKGLRPNRDDFDSGDILHGIQLIHQTARVLGRPYVINLSLGGHQGGHDGSTLLEQAIAKYSGANKPGQIIVASAGNEGGDPIHASGWLQSKDTIHIPIKLPTSRQELRASDPSPYMTFELWLPASARVEWSLETPSGEQTAWFSHAKQPAHTLRMKDGVLISGYQAHTQPKASHRFSFMLAQDTGQKLKRGIWKLFLRGTTSRFDLWLTGQLFPQSIHQVALKGYVTQEMLIGVPGSTAAVLTVGSYNSRTGWSNANGVEVTQSSIADALSSFSSMGPTRDGRIKPELVAPGLYIAATAPIDPISQEAHRLPGGLFQISQGTSQAAPHVAGGIALMLQLQPKLTTPQVRDLLTANSQTDQHTHPKDIHAAGWGFGKLHLLHTIRSLKKGLSHQTIHLPSTTLHTSTHWLPADGVSQTKLYFTVRDQTKHPTQSQQRITFHAEAGTLTPAQKDAPGIYTSIYTADTQPNQRVVITAQVDGQTSPSKVHLELKAPASDRHMYGCGCTSSKKTPPLSFGLLLLVLWFWKGIRGRLKRSAVAN